MNTDEVFKMLLLETPPERAGRVGYLRRLNAEKAKKSAEFWNNDDAWNAAKKAQQKYDSHTATVDKHMKKFSRDRDSDWAKKLAAGYKGEETDTKNMRRNIKIGAGVGLGLAGAYGAYRLLRGKKKPVEKGKVVTPTKSAEPKKNVINTRQDPTEPASYPFKDSTDAVWANLMEGAIANYLKQAREFSKQHKKPFKVTRMRGPKGERIVNVQGISPSGSMFHPTSPKAVLHASHAADVSKLSASARQSIHSPEEFLATAKKLPVKKAHPKTLQHELVHYNDNTHVPRSERIAGIMNKHLQATKGKPDEAFMKRGEQLMVRTHLRGEAKAFSGLIKQRKGKKPTKLTANDRDMRSGMASYLRMGRAYKLPDLNKRYKNFKAAGGYDSPTAHLKLSADSVWQNLREVEYLPGGRAEGKPSRAFPKGQLRMGRKVEMEHTRNPRVATEIAKDHLAEFKDYYTRLAQMERKAKRSR